MTTTKTPPEEIAALEYLDARAAAEGIAGLVLRLENSASPAIACAPCAKNGAVYGWGKTLEEAIADLRGRMISPALQAAQLRDEAAKLIAKAAAVEAAAA